jgi:hypothetical protein
VWWEPKSKQDGGNGDVSESRNGDMKNNS